MERLIASRVKIRFSDCDPLGHLYNGHYIRYMQNAREDHILAAYDLHLGRMWEKENAGWVVMQNQIAYLRPADADEFVEISSCIVRYNERYNDVEMVMWSEDRSTIKSLMWTRFAFVQAEPVKSIPHFDRFLEMFEKILVPVGEDRFEERVKRARGVNKKAGPFYS